MRRSAAVSWACAVFLSILVGDGGRALAQPRPSSDLLLPSFAVDFTDGEATTTFTVSNQLDTPVDLLAAVQTNWGIQVLSVARTLQAGEVWTVDLRDWIQRGELPGGALSAEELADLQAALSGQAVPGTGLYVSTASGGSGRAVGSLTVRTLGSRPDALRGEYDLLDPGQGFDRGGPLADIDPAARPAGLCARHTVRHLRGSDVGEAEVALWMALPGPVLPAPEPEDRRTGVTVSVFSADGTLVQRRVVPLLPSQRIPLADLGLTEARGRVVLVTGAPSSVQVLSEAGTTFEAFCGQVAPEKPAIRIVTLVNGEDANTPPGPSIPVGERVTWRYRVTNSGASVLQEVAVTDDQGVKVRCPETVLQPGQSMTCTARSVAEACEHEHIGTVRATGRKGVEVTAQDPGHYRGDIGDAIDLEVSTNGEDADDPTGPQVPAGSRVDWTYEVTNRGEVRLLDIAVTDDQVGAVECPQVILAPGEPMTCFASGIAAAGQFENVGTVTATSSCDTPVTDSDASHYFGESDAGLELQAFTNGEDADDAPGPSIPVGEPVLWEYVVTNSGQLPVSGIAVSDDQGVEATCPDTSLAPGGSMTCVARGAAVPCQYKNVGTVTGQISTGETVAASDPSHYFGEATAAIRIESAVNGEDADQPPGPTAVAGTSVSWTFVVTNIGELMLTGITVSDGRGRTPVCPKTELRPGESMTCLLSHTAFAGQRSAVARVTGQPPCGGQVTDTDPGYYTGVLP